MEEVELINKIASASGLTTEQSKSAVDALLETVMDALEDGDQVKIEGFGVFKSVERQARKGRNPQTGEWINIEAATVPTFTAEKAFKDRLN